MNTEQSNPFDDESQRFFVITNTESQCSLWPEFAPVPAGWNRLLGPASRTACLQFLETSWTDIRPASLQALL